MSNCARLWRALTPAFFVLDDTNRLMGHAISALNFMHEQKRLVHGDFKPQNILINNDMSHTWLADFGAAGGELLLKALNTKADQPIERVVAPCFARDVPASSS